MSDYFLASSLAVLRAEVNTQFPKRDKSSDGWIGDASHAARPSSHNPCWACTGRLHGVVRGLDIDVDDRDTTRDLRRALLNEVIGDPRVWYVISNRVIYSRTYGWRALAYDGANGHFGHVHVSLMETADAAFNTAPWFGPAAPAKVTAPAVDLPNVRQLFASDYLTKSVQVQRIEKALNERMPGTRPIKVDGHAKRETRLKYKAWQQHLGMNPVEQSGIPDGYSLRLLGTGGRFRVVA